MNNINVIIKDFFKRYVHMIMFFQSSHLSTIILFQSYHRNTESQIIIFSE